MSTFVRQELSALACALMFLTRLPVPAGEYSDTALAKSVVYFPLVGVAVGLAGSATYLLAHLIWPESIATVLALAVMIACTGAFHEDGLADSADGIGGGWSVEDKLAIMKDSRIGTYGSAALILALLLKFAALASLNVAAVPVALIIGHALSRWSILPLVRCTDYVSGDRGSGKAFENAVTGARLASATFFVALLVLGFAANNALVLALVTVAVIIASRWYCQRKLGGITGDTLGATNQLIELSVYLVFAAGA